MSYKHKRDQYQRQNARARRETLRAREDRDETLDARMREVEEGKRASAIKQVFATTHDQPQD